MAVALGLFVASPASAFLLNSPTTVGGNFATDDEHRVFEFTISADSIVTIETVSYAGGVHAGGGAVQPPGGFDPIISLFDSAGLFIDEDDFDDDFLDPTPTLDPVSGAAFDAFLQTSLVAGTYQAVITQFDNFFNGIVGDPITNGFLFDGVPDLTAVFGCVDGQFCDVFGNQRTNAFAINLSAEALAVPEPGALAMLGFGLLGVGMVYRRRLQG
jgi:hypothetical protein